MKRIIILTWLILTCVLADLQAKVLNDSIAPGKNFDKAIFRMWYPDDAKIINGIIVLVPGSNGDGRGETDDKGWQDFAKKNGFALLGCWFTDRQHPDMFIENYINVSEGSGQALLDAIEKFGKKSGIGGVKDAPLLLWGHSAGGQFNYEFVCWKPERVIGFVVNKGGIYYSALASSETRRVPGLLFTGQKDLDARKDIIKGIFSMNRRAGALWAFAEEPEAGHEVGMTKKLAMIFFDEIIGLRLAGNEKSVSSNGLKPLIPEYGLIGDFKSLALISYEQGKKLNYPASWLPGQSTGQAYISFIKKLPFAP